MITMSPLRQAKQYAFVLKTSEKKRIFPSDVTNVLLQYSVITLILYLIQWQPCAVHTGTSKKSLEQNRGTNGLNDNEQLCLLFTALFSLFMYEIQIIFSFQRCSPI